MSQISQGAAAALRRLSRTEHRSEMVFRGYANEPPIGSEEAIELAKAGYAELNGRSLRITSAGVALVDATTTWPER